MISISEYVKEFVQNTPLLEEGLARGIINLSALARELKPELEKKLMKPVAEGSIVMALKRMGARLKKKSHELKNMAISLHDLTVRSNLLEYTYTNSDSLIEKYSRLAKQFGSVPDLFFTITQGVRETTFVISSNMREMVKKGFVGEKLISKVENLSVITVRHPEGLVYTPGLHYIILKSLFWENINVIESVSAYTEFSVVVENKDVDRSFSVLKRLIES